LSRLLQRFKEEFVLAFDGLFTHAMVHELNQTLSTWRISRIHQPYPTDLFIIIRANRKNHKLLLSANPTYPRIQLTETNFQNPPVPTKFAMTMRKYLEGAILTSIKQVDNDRVVKFNFSTRDELGDEQDLTLIVEIMARHSNITLLSVKTNKIIDTIKHVSSDQNRYRLLLPGAQYIEPPKQDKVNPFIANQVYSDLARQKDSVDELAQKLQTSYQGFGKDMAKELATRLTQSEDHAHVYQQFLTEFDHATPSFYQGQSTRFSAISLKSVAESGITFATLSELLDKFYASKVQLDRAHQIAGELIHLVDNELKKNKKKIRKLNQTLEDTKKADNFRIKGEVLTTYLQKIKPGMTEIELPDFYHDNQPLKISLSNQLTASQNAQKYFTKYQKLKNAVAHVDEQLALANEEIEYLTNLAAQLEIAGPADIEEIKLELQQQGYLKNKSKKKKNKRPSSQPLQLKASDGTTIMVGKNNYQNDRLTFKIANKNDIWLHVKDIPGSHVVIRSNDPSEETITQAAQIAAFYSKARMSDHVQVDYLPIKKVRKPNGAKPGFVVFEGQTTISVTPQENFN
jgi:predicted ribosome quality control (RQC) complex YloA/Tae2 family protein